LCPLVEPSIMTELLLGIDEDEDRAISQAETVVDLFDPDDVHVYLLHDFVDNPEGASVTQIKSVQRAQEVLEEAGASVELREASGDPAQSIRRAADRLDADAICVAGRKRSPTGKALFGSVSQEVVLNTDRPVLFSSSEQAD
jgi:nucleotide-binding universal stress UspA family protein